MKKLCFSFLFSVWVLKFRRQVGLFLKTLEKQGFLILGLWGAQGMMLPAPRAASTGRETAPAWATPSPVGSVTPFPLTADVSLCLRSYLQMNVSSTAPIVRTTAIPTSRVLRLLRTKSAS